MKLVAPLLALIALLVTACLPVTQPGQAYGPPAYTAGAAADTGVYFNGQELTAAEQAQLEVLIGATVPPGRYFLDAQGNAGPEGGPAVVNLVELARARGYDAGAPRAAPAADDADAGATQIFSTGPTGPSSMTAVGDCIMVSTPDVSFDSGC